MRLVFACLGILCVLAPVMVRADEAAARAFIDRWMAEAAGDSDAGETDVRMGFVDLDGDGSDEAVVLLSGPYWCGSGGCNAMVLRADGESYDILMDASVTQAPIGVLGTSSHGFRDLFVHIGGGGLPFGPVAMRFDGERYPDNPTVDGEDLPEGFKGKELIGAE